MTTKDAVDHIVKELKKDPGYRIGWTANIAMSYIDAEHRYKKKTGKKYLNRFDKHVIANNAAGDFIDLLCRDKKEG